MNIIQNIRFIQQIDNGCCPASINIVLDYYKKGIRLNQELILTEFKKYQGSLFERSESFFNQNIDFNHEFRFKKIDTINEKDWENTVKKYINEGTPVIISTPVSKTSYHITVIFGYFENILFELCPTYGYKNIYISDKLANYTSIGGTDLLIIEKI